MRMGSMVGLAGATSTFCDNADDPTVTREDSGTRKPCLLAPEASVPRTSIGAAMDESVTAPPEEIRGSREGSELVIDVDGLLRIGVIMVDLGLESPLLAADEVILLWGLMISLWRLAGAEKLLRGAISTWR